MKIQLRYKGGSGSGNYGHSGIPGHLGGSAAGSDYGQSMTLSQKRESNYGFTKHGGNRWTKTLGKLSATAVITPKKTYGREIGQNCRVDFYDPRLKKGIVHEPLRFDSITGKLDLDNILRSASAELERISKL